jgi:hypothetical protein
MQPGVQTPVLPKQAKKQTKENNKRKKNLFKCFGYLRTFQMLIITNHHYYCFRNLVKVDDSF